MDRIASQGEALGSLGHDGAGTSLRLILKDNSNKMEINLEKSECQPEALEINLREMGSY